MTDEAKTAPVYRSVEAQSGAVAPVSMAAALTILDHLTKDRDALVEKVQGLQAETELVRHMLLKATSALDSTTVELVHALNARDDAERECGELRDQLEAARCRVDEMSYEIRDLRTALADAGLS